MSVLAAVLTGAHVVQSSAGGASPAEPTQDFAAVLAALAPTPQQCGSADGTAEPQHPDTASDAAGPMAGVAVPLCAAVVPEVAEDVSAVGAPSSAASAPGQGSPLAAGPPPTSAPMARVPAPAAPAAPDARAAPAAPDARAAPAAPDAQAAPAPATASVPEPPADPPTAHAPDDGLLPSPATSADLPAGAPATAAIPVTGAPPAPTPAPTPAPVPAAALTPPGAQVALALAPVLEGPDGTYTMSLQLHPEELGALHVEVAMRNGEISLSLHAPDPAAREALRGAIPELLSRLESTGLTATGVSVDGGRTGDRPAGSPPQRPATRSGGAEPQSPADEPAARLSASERSLDLRI